MLYEYFVCSRYVSYWTQRFLFSFGLVVAYAVFVAFDSATIFSWLNVNEHNSGAVGIILSFLRCFFLLFFCGVMGPVAKMLPVIKIDLAKLHRRYESIHTPMQCTVLHG